MNKEEIKKDKKQARMQLGTLRDEIRLHIHLGSMEAKERWEKLQPRFFEAEKYIDQMTDAGAAVVEDVIKRARELRDQLKATRESHKNVGQH